MSDETEHKDNTLLILIAWIFFGGILIAPLLHAKDRGHLDNRPTTQVCALQTNKSKSKTPECERMIAIRVGPRNWLSGTYDYAK